MQEQYDPGGPKHVWNWLHEKKGLSCARPRKSGMHIKTSHKFFCHNSNRDTNLASNFLSEETAWRNIILYIVFARAKNVATRLISLLFVKIPLKLFGPANFDSVRWNIALHQTECPVKYFCLRKVWYYQFHWFEENGECFHWVHIRDHEWTMLRVHAIYLRWEFPCF